MKIKLLLLFFSVGSVIKSYSQVAADIYTPACTPLYNSYYFDEYPGWYITQLNNSYINAYPNATFIANSSGQYNCHGYAWFVTEGGSKVWIGAYAGQGDPEEEFMNDGSYIEVSTEAEAKKVSYRNSDHSAITSGTPGYLISKWADGPVMKHTPSNCPFSYSYLRYYTSEKKLNGVIYSGTYTSIGEINSSGSVASSTNVKFNAGRRIMLKPGFRAQNCHFEAKMIAACWPGESTQRTMAVPEASEPIIEIKSTEGLNENFIQDNFQGQELSLFPNPTTSDLYVLGADNFGYKVVDFYGRTIISEEFHTGKIDLTSLKAGVYFILINYNGTNSIHKVIKQ